ncbi:hypothetical protein COL97_05325 [Bacillus safensis]|nr:hypothetical protein COL97_05325 [Bacillus safensis]
MFALIQIPSGTVVQQLLKRHPSRQKLVYRILKQTLGREGPRTTKPRTKLGGFLNIPHGEQAFQSLKINFI